MGNWYTIEDIGREAGLCILPSGGAWVCIVGCPVWPRGKRIVKIHREIGIRHLDIYWGHKETMQDLTVRRFRRPRIKLTAAIAYDVSDGYLQKDALNIAVDELRRHTLESPFELQRHLHSSLITISYPHPEEVRFYNSEVRVLSSGSIRELLAMDGVDVIKFGETQTPVLEDAAKELVDAFKVDGLSEAEAYQQVVAAGEVEPGEFIPQWFYRPKGLFKQQFCEEIDETD